MSNYTTNNYDFESFYPSLKRQKNSSTDLGTRYGGTVCGFHTIPHRNYYRVGRRETEVVGLLVTDRILCQSIQYVSVTWASSVFLKFCCGN